MAILLHLKIVSRIVAAMYIQRYEKLFKKALSIAAPGEENAEARTRGLNEFQDSLGNGKTLNDIASNALKIASNGNNVRYENAVTFMNNNIPPHKHYRIDKWFWLLFALIFSTLVIIALLLFLGTFNP